jgi:hypothetical protein
MVFRQARFACGLPWHLALFVGSTPDRADGENEEHDLLGVANGSQNELVVVKIKSHVRERDLGKLLEKRRRVPQFLPQHRDMTVRGKLAAVYHPKGMSERIEAAGLFLATGADENFTMVPPSPGFRPASSGA